jgi:hypothetical protein
MLRARRAITPDGWALLAVGAAVLLANLPYLLGFFHPNPLNFRAGLTSTFTPGLLPGRPTIDPSNGFTSQAIGHLAALDLLHLHLPWWNPYEGTGMPLLGETQSAALFPPTLLTALSNGQLYEHILLEFVAGVFTYLLLRRLGVGRVAATVGAIAYALNGKFAWFSDAGVNPLPFLPMLLFGIERAYAAARDGRPGGWRLLALAGALSVYAGFPEVAYINTLMGVAWGGWRLGCLERGRRRTFAAKSGLGAVAGALLAAPMLVAMGTYLTHADLAAHASSQLGGRHLPLSALPQLVMPYVYGQVNTERLFVVWLMVGGYLSATLLLLAVFGLFSPNRRGLKLVLLGFALLVFARMYGEPPLLGHVIGVLPGMSKIQFYRYGTAALELPIIVLAALGLDDLIRNGARWQRVAATAAGVLIMVAVAAIGAKPVVHSLGTQFHHDTWFRVSIIWGALTVAGVAAFALLRSARVRAGALAALVAVDAVALFVVPEFAAPRATHVDFTPVSYLRAHLGEGRFYTLGPISPDYGSYFGLASVGVDDFPPTSYAHFVLRHLDPGSPFVGFRAGGPSATSELMHHLAGYRTAGVRYVLTPAAQPLPSSRGALRLAFRSPTTRIYRLGGALPYFTARGCGVSSGDRENVQVACPKPTTLVRRETWLDGWTAQLDGRPATIRRSGGLFQAVRVPAGSHRLTFTFAPPGMGWAFVGLLAGCALMLLPTIRRRWARRRPSSPARDDEVDVTPSSSPQPA